MTEFVVQLYASRDDAVALSRVTERVRHAAEELGREGTVVRYMTRIFVPEDETCLLLYEADTAETVRAATDRAGLAVERISEAISEPSSSTRADSAELARPTTTGGDSQ